MDINIMAFGYKFGVPSDANVVFDVRCFPNPFYLPELKDKTGNDADVQEYVLSTPQPNEFLAKLEEMILMLIPIYEKSGKESTTIAIGCTGGRHRSVTFANKLGDKLKNEGYDVNMIYRDIEKDVKK